MPSTRTLARGGGVLALLALQGVAVAQPSGRNPGSEVGIVAEFLIGLVIYLLLGGGLVALAPEYATKSVNEIRDDPGGAFGWGLLVGIGGAIALIILAITVVGLIVAIPGAILLFVLGVVGNAVTIVWIGHTLAGSGESVGGKAAGVGALVLAAIGAIPVLGALVLTIAEMFGLGVVSRGVYTSWRE